MFCSAGLTHSELLEENRQKKIEEKKNKERFVFYL